MSDITITERKCGDVVILSINGKITIGEGCVELRREVRRQLGEGWVKILLDLEDVSYIDSSGIGELDSSKMRVEVKGGVIKLLSLRKKIKDLLVITKLLTVFDCYEDREEALFSFM